MKTNKTLPTENYWRDQKNPPLFTPSIPRRKLFPYCIWQLDVGQWSISAVDQQQFYGRHFGWENGDGARELVLDTQPIAADSVKQFIWLWCHVDALDNLQSKTKTTLSTNVPFKQEMKRDVLSNFLLSLD